MSLATSEPDRSISHRSVSRKAPWYFNAYLQIGLSVVLSSAAQLFFKIGTDRLPESSLAGLGGLGSGYVWMGIGCFVVGLVSWLYALRSVPLTIAFNLAAGTQVLVPIACWLFLGEQISALRWAGIAIVIIGITIVAQPLSKIEERL